MLLKRKMKGQYFILGTVMIIALFFLGLQFGKPLIHPSSENLDFIYKNIEYEFPYALNLGINKTTPIETLKNFTRYVDESFYFVNFSTLWVVTNNVDFGGVGPTHTLNITIGNFLDHDVTVNVTVDGSSINVTIPNNQTNSTTFEINALIVGSNIKTITLNLTFDGTTFGMENIPLNKYNFYSLVKLRRGTDFKKEEIIETVNTIH